MLLEQGCQALSKQDLASRTSHESTTERGHLFVFEGPDGVGKTTLSRAFARELSEEGVPCEYLAFSGSAEGTLGKHVYDLHHDLSAFGVHRVHPVSLQLLHVASHIDSWHNRILPALRIGKTVILDRYWWSTWVYGVASGADLESLDLMLKLETLHTGGVVPKAVFLVTRETHASENASPDERLLEEYRRLALRECAQHPVVTIQNNDRLEEALELIRAWVRERAAHIAVRSASQPHGRAISDEGGGLTVLTSLAPAKPTVVYDTYWRFAAERQAIFFKSLRGQSFPWTDDRILQDYRFTNAYRAADRVSQYLMKQVIYGGDSAPEEVFFRTILFKIFNRIETWELLTRHFGTVSYAEFSINEYSRVLKAALAKRTRIYSAAYIMPSGGAKTGKGKKHEMHLRLINQMMRDELPKRVAEARSMRDVFELLRSYPTIGDFLAYQYASDINYSPLTTFSEMEFVAPGPGARDGLRKCFSDFGGLNEAELIRAVADRQSSEFARLGIDFETLWGRPLQLIDCQNLFCEVDKYARLKHPEFQGLSGRTRIKQRYRVNTTSIEYFFPPKWGINGALARDELPKKHREGKT